MPYVPEHAAALFSCRLIDTVDVGTHLLFIGEVEDAERLSGEAPLTYDYYHKVLKGKTPPKASSYQVDFQSQRNSLNGPRVSAASATRN